MRRLAVLLLLCAAPAFAGDETPAELRVGPVAELASRIVLGVEGCVPHALADRVVALELGLRDLAHGAEARLVAWTAKLPSPAPDLAVLTTSPIEDDESSGFGWRDDPIRHDMRFHSGTDFHADPGTPVRAAGSGVVVFAGRQGGYGNIIYVDHGGGVITRYAHLRRIETTVDAKVAAGERIGQVGSTGRVTGPHLHFEVRLDGRAVDPVTAMTVASLERESPVAGRLASFALAPELQAKARDGSDRHRGQRPAPCHPTDRADIPCRPERAGRAPRPQVLW